MSYELADTLPVSLIRQYAFCPRIPWFNLVMGWHPPSPLWTQQGVQWHERQQMLQKRRSLKPFGIPAAHYHHNVRLYDAELGVHGIADTLMETADEIIPLEYKHTTRKPTRGHILQLATYGLLAQNHFNKPARRGFILYGNRGQTLPIEITPYQPQVENIISEIRKTLELTLIPPSPATAHQCTQCEYHTYCNDRE